MDHGLERSDSNNYNNNACEKGQCQGCYEVEREGASGAKPKNKRSEVSAVGEIWGSKGQIERRCWRRLVKSTCDM